VNESYGLLEKDINLDVSYGLKALLEEDGAQVVMTRFDDAYRDNGDRYTFCNSEAATILVSVHTNSTTDPTMDGSLALYFHRDDEVLAQAIYDVMYPALRDTAPDPGNFTGFGLDRFASGVLLKSDMPAAMMEPLFMSHPQEAQLLVQPITDGAGAVSEGCPDLSCRRGQIAQAIHAGVLNYVGAGADAPPSVSITHPSDGATVSGAVTVAAEASDDDAVTQVEFFLDGVSLGADTDGSDGWSTSWDTTGAVDGSHTLEATATDSAGQLTSDSISVEVDNSGGGETISLTAAEYKVKGLQKVDLVWSGATSPAVDVLRNGVLIATTENDGAYRDDIDERGPGAYTYQVCEAGSSICSNQAKVSF
jgi:hypothetical protein